MGFLLLFESKSISIVVGKIQIQMQVGFQRRVRKLNGWRGCVAKFRFILFLLFLSKDIRNNRLGLRDMDFRSCRSTC